MYSLRCNKCGWNEEMNSILYNSCPNCGDTLIIEDYGQDIDPRELENEINEDLNNRYIEQQEMMNNILTTNNKKMWNNIETIKNPKLRIHKRKIFLELGGKVPKGEDIKI